MIKNVAKMLKKIMLNANSGRNIRFSTRQTPKGSFPVILGRTSHLRTVRGSLILFQVSDRREVEIKKIEVRLCRGYIIQSIARAGLEITFCFLQFRLFGFEVKEKFLVSKVGCVFPTVIIPILPKAEFGPNDHFKNS